MKKFQNHVHKQDLQGTSQVFLLKFRESTPPPVLCIWKYVRGLITFSVSNAMQHIIVVSQGFKEHIHSNDTKEYNKMTRFGVLVPESAPSFLINAPS